jgi:hypothetical protein
MVSAITVLGLTGCLASSGDDGTSASVAIQAVSADVDFPSDDLLGGQPPEEPDFGEIPTGDNIEGDLRDDDLVPGRLPGGGPPQRPSGDGDPDESLPTSPATPTVTVTTAAELVAHLGSNTPETIIVPGGAVLDLTAYAPITIKAGKTLKSNRGGMRLGARLYTTDNTRKYELFTIAASNVRIEGVRILGPTGGVDEPYSIVGIRIKTGAVVNGQPVRYSNIVVTNNELAKWPGAAVSVSGPLNVDCFDDLPPADRAARPPHVMSKSQASQIAIHNNYIHHNQRDDFGYGVVVGGGAYASIQANVFDQNRHAIASSGTPYSGYIARYNYNLEETAYQNTRPFGYYPAHYDMHGCGSGGFGGDAGEYIEVAYNTIRGEQSYGGGLFTRPAFAIRGIPRDAAWFLENVVVHNDADAAISVKGNRLAANIYEAGNTYDADHSFEIGVGDFDGDDRDDVFTATGAGWYYSSGGIAPWRFLTRSSRVLADVAIGDFDGDGYDDIFEGTGSQWRYFSGHERAWKDDLASSSARASALRFGDFDGNGTTDVFRADGTHWFVSWDARSAWQQINVSEVGIQDMRLGDFDGDGKTDVFSMVLGQWSWSRSGTGSWKKLNDRLVNGIGNVRLGDFNGDGKTDVAFAANPISGPTWYYASAGKGAAIQLRVAAGGYNTNLHRGVVGRFLAGSKDVFVRYSEYVAPAYTGKSLVAWYIGAPGDGFVPHSSRNMR